MDDRAGAYPADFGLELDSATRRPTPDTLIGGSPLRVLRLSGTGSRLLDTWLSGRPVGSGAPARLLARRLVDAGVAQPRPPRGAGPGRDDVTVVVPVRDRPDGLAATLAALGDLNVVVVDDASSDAVTLPGREVIRRDVAGGPAAARNTGWHSDARPVLVFLDADCVPEPDWLERLLPHLADPRVGAVAPRVTPATGAGLITRYEQVMSPLDMGAVTAAVSPATRVPYVPTACLAVRRCALVASGGFDEGLRFGEDVDLVWRLIDSGWVVRYEPLAKVRHPARPGVASMMRQRFDYGRSAAPLAARHGSDVAPLSVSAWSAGVWALAAFGRVLPASALVAAGSTVVAERVAADASSRRVLASLAATGTLNTGKWVATAVRRAWAVPLVVAVCCSPRGLRRRAAAWLGVSFLVPVVDWAAPARGCGRPEMGVVPWTLLRWIDDLSYQSGVWAGVLEHRSLRAVLPRWRPRTRLPVRQAAATTSSSASPVSR